MSKARELINILEQFEVVETSIDESSDSDYSHDTMGKTTTVKHKGYKIGEVVHRGGDKHIATVMNAGDKVRKNKQVDSKEKGIEFIKAQHKKHGAFDDKIG